MIGNGGKHVVILLCGLLGWSWSAAAQELTVEGGVSATSFTGDGSNLTGVPDQVFHGFFEVSCAAATTCVVFNNCPADFEITGGGFFINSANAAARAQVILHQSYRGTTTQWVVEATNGSGIALGFGSVAECTRVAPSPPPVSPPSLSATPPGLDLSRVLLVCPEWDTARYVEPQDAGAAHFCPNHGYVLKGAGGGPSPIPLEPEPEAEASAER